ncbi:palmdelphin isoform X2 [Syngnathus typhle]|uniref:palmdelphin isoform X2 n=1 Tax=Syngnathus typhle TaxID=161592 RepID=UPI002A6B6B05|nr:palmdelphin isoform X2 [Syngnathus typhle]
MEETDLLKERLQAITDKRRIQEHIAKKRRELEEEKLKLQYIKKKSLREQWLMDGQQSEEEQEAMRLQVQDEQQQSDELQSNIEKIEKEIEALETEELNISANEEFVLKRLKEVERTPEDIIKELSADFHTDATHHSSLCPPEIPLLSPRTPAKSPSPKSATFAMEISVEHDKRTGTSQVVSTATISPENIQERGLKVYDDGRKSIYALNPDVDDEMTSKQVDELLRQATDENVPRDLLYHQPVYSVAYSGSKPPNKAQVLPKGQMPSISSTQLTQEQVERTTPAQSLNEEEMMVCDDRIQNRSETLSPRICAKTAQDNKKPVNSLKQEPVVTVKVRSGEKPMPLQLVSTDKSRTLVPGHNVDSLLESSGKTKPESFASTNLFNNQTGELDSTPITMIFMGYENALDEDDTDFQAELVTVGCGDDEDEADYIGTKNNGEIVSYHPEGYKSKIFQPQVAKIYKCMSRDDNTNWNHLGLHRPTFIHKSGNRV